MNLEGKIIGNRYEMQQKIGTGGMATVYKAKDIILKRFVAVKVLRDEFTTDNEFIRRFNTEAQAAASLTHPNIVSIYDVGNEGSIYYIVMELVQGKTLKEIINEDGVLPWKWSINISIQIASALEMAHKNNIVHRDIKPHNIIITEEGTAKVTDFGIAKAVSNSTITAFGTTIGSVHYFSPEHARGGYTDAKSDLYSLGVVMYEMLTGRVPFDADTPVSVALKHMQEKPVEPIKLNPSIPYSINKIIMKAMQKESNLRYSSATEMLKDLGLSLKEPEGNFVREATNENAYTQRIPTIQEEQLNKKNSETKEKKGKLAKYFEENPGAKKAIIIIAIIALIILIPFVGFYGTQFILNIGRVKDVQIPDFVNISIEEARTKATESKLQLEIEEQYNKDIEAGKVISQEPPYSEGYLVKENSTVKVIVSKGIETTIVPKITGMTYEEAEEELKKSNLVAEKIEEISEKVEEGYVIKQEPEEETQVNAGDTVKVHVSIGNGLEDIVMPYVIGEKESAAKKTLSKLEVTVVYEEDTTKDDGTVLKQSIDSGTTVEEGTAVTITVNKIQQIKEGTVNINLKSLTGGIIEKDEQGNEIEPEVELEVRASDETVYKENHRKDTTNINVTVSGKGTITIKVFVNGVRKSQEQLNLNSSNPVLNID